MTSRLRLSGTLRTPSISHLLFSVAAVLIAIHDLHGASVKPFERFTGCKLEPDKWTDGDSFRVRLKDGRLETFRLYFVDTPEALSHSMRSDQQGQYFGLTRPDAVKLGRIAKDFTSEHLSKPFTIVTRWTRLFDTPRYYAFVFTKKDDLAELLVKNGLARIYGESTTALDGRNAD